MNISECPRTFEAIRDLMPMVRYRFALTLGVVPNDSNAIQGFSTLSVDEQAHKVLAKMIEQDQNTPPPQGQPTSNGAPPNVPRQPDAISGQPPPQQMGVMPPQGYAPPPPNGGYAGQPPPGFMHPQQMQPSPQQYVQQQPPPQGYQQPPPQQYMQPPPGQMQQPPRTPSTSTDPGLAQANAGAVTAGAAAASIDLTSKALTTIINKLDGLSKTVDDEVAGVEDLDEVRTLCLGIAAQQQLNSVMLLMVYEAMNPNFNRETLCGAIRAEVKKDPISPLLAGLRTESEGAPKG